MSKIFQGKTDEARSRLDVCLASPANISPSGSPPAHPPRFRPLERPGDAAEVRKHRVDEDTKFLALDASGHQKAVPNAEAFLHQVARRWDL